MHQYIKFILFWDDTLHVSDDLSVHHQEYKTVHTATGICPTDQTVSSAHHEGEWERADVALPIFNLSPLWK
jgi:hypothetical protein